MSKSTVSSSIFSRMGLAILLLALVLALNPGRPALAAPGVDGNETVAAANTVLNRYSAVTSITGNTVTVSNIAQLNDGGSGHYTNNTLSTGDMILIYQTQGASFSDTTDSATWGAFNYNSAGRYEFAAVAGVVGNVITVDATNSPPYSCGGIVNSYDTTNGRVQVVRVPQYSNLTINVGASVVASDWSGTTGGIVALLTQSTMAVNGSINVNGQGFRGAPYNISGFTGSTTYRSTATANGAEKGESILGYLSEYDSNGLGRYGRGAPANGGGGASTVNPSGGGGANGDNGGTWTGAGSPDTSNAGWNNAWDLDDGTDDTGTPLPAYFISGAGGGRGGYSWGANDGDATVHGPGNAAWGGDTQRQIGGLGGRPVNNQPATRLFFGGGGGAGDGNDVGGGAAGDGGGLIVIGAVTLSGSGQLIANGVTAGNSNAGPGDGTSGGGAGGTIVVQAGSVSGVSAQANGGNGGNHVVNASFNLSPGGGGGGGYIAVDANTGSLSLSVAGGSNGTTGSTKISEFVPMGATQGYAGGSSTAAFTFPGCTTPTAISWHSLTVAGGAAGRWLFTFMAVLGLMSLLVLRRKNA
jgi:hypothetical protein